MKWFIENATPANIGIALALAIIALACGKWFLYMLDQGDEAFRLDNPMDTDPEQVDRDNAEYYGLSLKAQRDLAALKRGTKL
jgi:hypothetical protein